MRGVRNGPWSLVLWRFAFWLRFGRFVVLGSDQSNILIIQYLPSSNTYFLSLDAHFRGQNWHCKRHRSLSVDIGHEFLSDLFNECFTLDGNSLSPLRFSRRHAVMVEGVLHQLLLLNRQFEGQKWSFKSENRVKNQEFHCVIK